MQLVSGSNCRKLACKIAKNTGFEIVYPTISKFNDGEIRIDYLNSLQQNVAIIQSLSIPTNDNLIELLLLADTAYHAGARNITAVIPYLGYCRQDRKASVFSSQATNFIARLLQNGYFSKVITLDIHSKAAEGSFNIPLVNLQSFEVFSPHIDTDEEVIFVAPDRGSINRTSFYANYFNKAIVTIDKNRIEGSVFAASDADKVKHKKCIIIDDIIDTGLTIKNAACLLLENGAKTIEVFASHGLFSVKAEEVLNSLPVDRVYLSDSITYEFLPSNITVVSTAQPFARELLLT